MGPLKPLVFRTKSPSQTKNLGKALAKETLKRGRSLKAAVFGLEGNLGGGKTTFAQGFAKGLGVEENITSPSFVLMKVYPLKSRGFKNFIHIDAYRVDRPKEILDLGWKKIIADAKNIILVEWADRIRKIMPKNSVWLKFEVVGRNERKIVFKTQNHNLKLKTF